MSTPPSENGIPVKDKMEPDRLVRSVPDGEIEVRSEAGIYVAQKSSFANIPKEGLIHGFKNKPGIMPSCCARSYLPGWNFF